MVACTVTPARHTAAPRARMRLAADCRGARATGPSALAKLYTNDEIPADRKALRYA